MKDIIYTEIQRFRNTLFMVIVAFLFLFVVFLFGYGYYIQIVLHQQFGNNPMSDIGLIITGSFTILTVGALVYLFLTSKLEIYITKDGIYYRYFPFILKMRKILKTDISNWVVREYKPIREFGGWGLRYNYRTKTSCYNIRGTMGLELHLTNDRKILLGTQKPVEIKHAMNELLGLL